MNDPPIPVAMNNGWSDAGLATQKHNETNTPKNIYDAILHIPCIFCVLGNSTGPFSLTVFLAFVVPLLRRFCCSSRSKKTLPISLNIDDITNNPMMAMYDQIPICL
jgi:hypothetical protein